MKKGFTLIEIVVVVGVLGVIMVAATALMINSFRAKARVAVADVVEQGGGITLSELKNNIISATGVGMTCSSTEVSLMNINDGTITTLTCDEGVKIASSSANGTFDLTPGSIKVTGCDNFVSCDYVPDSPDRVSRVNFSFTMSLGDAAAGAEKYVSREFNSSVELRN